MKTRSPTASRAQRPGAALDQRVYVTVWTAAGALRRRAEAILQREDLSLQQYNILRILRGAGEALPTFGIAERMFDPSPAITRMVDRLVDRKLVRRQRTRADRRVVLCEITPAGIDLLGSLAPEIETMDQEVMGRLSDDKKRALVRLLEELMEGAA